MFRNILVGLMVFLLSASSALAQGLPDTGQTKCYDNETEIPCPSPGQAYYGQDGNYVKARSYTDLGNGIIRDNVTGLEWQKATAPGYGAGDYADMYNQQQALDYCAGLSLGGHSDWRVPTVKELSTLINYNIPFPGPSINTAYFPDTVTDWRAGYLSSTKIASSPEYTWQVDFRGGTVEYSWYGYLRAVRGNPLSVNNFIDHGDGTVTDTSTGLMWQKENPPDMKNWPEALAYCEGLSLAGYHDWRLPDKFELYSIVDYSRERPAINTDYFLRNYDDRNNYGHWSSTSIQSSPSWAWIVCFSVGGDGWGYWTDKSDNYYKVRAVRGGQYGSFDYLDIDQNGTPDIIENQNGFRGNSGYSADPVNTGTGNYVSEHVDLALPGPGMSFEFKRTYNSLNPADGPLGFGWNHSYNVRVQEFDSNTAVTWGDGQVAVYSAQGDGTFVPLLPGTYDILTKDTNTGTYSVLRKDQTVYSFNTAGRLASIIDKNGNTIALSYDGSGYLTSITDTAGRTIAVTCDASGRITALVDPLGRTVTFSYDAVGNLISATDPSGNETTYTYDSNHRMLTFVDPEANTVVTNIYDVNNRVVSQTDARGNITTLSYDSAVGGTTITDPLGKTTQHAYDEQYRLIRDTDAIGSSIAYTYDAFGNRTEIEDRNRHITRFAYDARGNVVSQADALGNVTETTWDATNNPLTLTDALDNITTFEYDTNGNLITTTDALGHVANITYNAKGQPLSITDPRGNTTTNAYDAAGNLTTVTDALGNVTTHTYDAAGRRLTTKNALNQTTTYAYDALDNIVSITDALGNAATFTYDGNSLKLSETDRNGNTTTYAYDAFGNLASVTDALGAAVTYTYDALNRKVSETDRNGNITLFGYDDQGRLASMTDALGNVTTYVYDNVGNRESERNPLGNRTAFAYDSLNRLVAVTDPLGNVSHTYYDELDRVRLKINAKGQTTIYTHDALGRLVQVTDAAGGTIAYTYDNNGNRLSETDPRGSITLFTYDKLNRLVQKDEPLDGQYQYDYDAAGNMVASRDPLGNQISYSYDAAGRLLSRTYPDASSVSYAYDNNGNKTGMTDSLGSSTYVYDAANRLTSYADPFGNTVSYTYDDEGNRLSITMPGSKTVQYAYDDAGRLATVSDWLGGVTTYSYDDADNLVQSGNPNGTVAGYAYDDAARLISLENRKSGGEVLASYNYTLDELGNHVRVVQTGGLAASLIEASTLYSYDSENRMTNEGTAEHVFDDNGNTVSVAGSSLVYDYDNRLVQNGSGQQYGYDGNGLRLTKTAAGATTRYVHDIGSALPEVVCEKDAGGAITAWYVYGLGLIAKILPDSSAYYYHFDSRGSTVAMTDSSETIVNAYVYDSFGTVLASSQTVPDSFKYLGRYGISADQDNLYYVRARYYRPGSGRFYTKDLLPGQADDSQSLNRYVYALNNPIRLIDISGFSALEGGAKNEWKIGKKYGVAYKYRERDPSPVSTPHAMLYMAVNNLTFFGQFFFGEFFEIPIGTLLNLLNMDDPRYEIDPNSFAPNEIYDHSIQA